MLWKSLKISEILWKSLEISDMLWKSLKSGRENLWHNFGKSLKFSEQLEGATHQLQHAASCCPNNRQHALEMVLHIELSRFFWWRNGSYSTGKTEQEKNCEEKHGSNSVLIRREYILTLPTVATPHPGEYMSCNPFPIDSSRKCVQPTESRILLFYLSSLAHCKQSREVVPISTVRIKGVLGVSPT